MHEKYHFTWNWLYISLNTKWLKQWWWKSLSDQSLHSLSLSSSKSHFQNVNEHYLKQCSMAFWLFLCWFNPKVIYWSNSWLERIFHANEFNPHWVLHECGSLSKFLLSNNILLSKLYTIKKYKSPYDNIVYACDFLYSH